MLWGRRPPRSLKLPSLDIGAGEIGGFRGFAIWIGVHALDAEVGGLLGSECLLAHSLLDEAVRCTHCVNDF